MRRWKELAALAVVLGAALWRERQWSNSLGDLRHEFLNCQEALGEATISDPDDVSPAYVAVLVAAKVASALLLWLDVSAISAFYLQGWQDSYWVSDPFMTLAMCATFVFPAPFLVMVLVDWRPWLIYQLAVTGEMVMVLGLVFDIMWEGGSTFLHLAASLNMPFLTFLLCKFNVYEVNVKTEANQTPLDLAEKHGNSAVIAVLRRYGGGTRDELMHTRQGQFLAGRSGRSYGRPWWLLLLSAPFLLMLFSFLPSLASVLGSVLSFLDSVRSFFGSVRSFLDFLKFLATPAPTIMGRFLQLLLLLPLLLLLLLVLPLLPLLLPLLALQQLWPTS